MKHKNIALVAIIFFTLTLISCGKSTPDETKNTQIANPASQYCIEQGGKIEIKTDENGSQYGLCILTDGTEIDEWEYFRNSQK